jgi:hypothetical protein
VTQAAALAVLGWTRAAIAAEQGCSEREVRRRLATAREAGLATEPPDARPPAPEGTRAAVAADTGKPKGGLVRCIGLTGSASAPAMIVRPGITAEGETPEQFRERTGNAGRGSLGKDYAPGDLVRDKEGNAVAQVVGSTTIRDSGPRQRALDAYLEQRPPSGATHAQLYDEDGTLIGVVAL